MAFKLSRFVRGVVSIFRPQEEKLHPCVVKVVRLVKAHPEFRGVLSASDVRLTVPRVHALRVHQALEAKEPNALDVSMEFPVNGRVTFVIPLPSHPARASSPNARFWRGVHASTGGDRPEIFRIEGFSDR